MIITITGSSGSGKSFIATELTTFNENMLHLNIDSIGHQALHDEEIKKE